MENSVIEMYTDGGARGNPGPAGCGAYSPQFGGRKKYIGAATNNVAEYSALIMAFEAAIEYKAQHPEFTDIDCKMDSELIVKQMNGEYKVKHPELQKLFVQVWNLKSQFRKVTFTHVRREFNKDADRLVNEAIDEALG